MSGGEREVVEALEPLWSTMGTCRYLGLAGSGQSCKMANQVSVDTSLKYGFVTGRLYVYMEIPRMIVSVY